MKKSGLTLLFAAMLFVLAACGGNSSSSDKEGSKSASTVSSGEEVYQQNCIGCHGKDLSGGGGPSLKEVGKKYNESQIAEIAQNGKGSMPSGMVDEKQAKQVAKWLAEKK
ncbi:cytochrome C' [Bacillus xiamenensis]|uniref:Cytochrome c n=1 Tax=Bacillus xiamenensis TaxID=1178537 RepID=A0ABT4EZZ2_9BACI|nr:cytochrome c [Bacillus xiamenensis]MBG9913024.1 cytochrome C' [Bacillus xiamenensis]MCY9575377.1 cytochrome c [Bacillus xiamenensis]